MPKFTWPGWPDARGWIGVGSFLLTIMVLWMVKEDSDLRKDEFFKVLATLIVSGYAKDVLGWAYQATKSGGELAEHNAQIVKNITPDSNKPQDVKVVGQSKPVQTTDVHDEDDGALPEDQRL